MTIKYNPVLAASIMFAILTYIWESEQNPEKEIKFVASADEEEGKPLAFWKSKQNLSKKNDSLFNAAQAPILLWATDNDQSTWSRKKATIVQCAFMLAYAKPTKEICDMLSLRMRAQKVVQQQYVDKIVEQYEIFGEEGNPIIALLASTQTVAKTLSKIINAGK